MINTEKLNNVRLRTDAIKITAHNFSLSINGNEYHENRCAVAKRCDGGTQVG